MKILLLNPFIDAEHELIGELNNRKFVVLLTGDGLEAWQLLQLHNASVDLAVVHREGTYGPGKPDIETGVKLINRIQADPAYAELPIIMTSEAWGEKEFSEHQAGSNGANAYLHWPFGVQDFISTIDEIFSGDEKAEKVKNAEDQGELVLEDAATMFHAAGDDSSESAKSDSAIHLDVSDLPDNTSNYDKGLNEIKIKLDNDDAQAVIEKSQPALEPESLVNQVEVPGMAETKLTPSEGIINELPCDGISPPVEISQLNLAAEVPEVSDLDDHEAQREMPYIFDVAKLLNQPVGDAVVPGGAAQSPDMGTMKKYLLLREQDVAALSGKLKITQDQLNDLGTKLDEERALAAELRNKVDEQKNKIDEFESEKQKLLEGLRVELEALRFEVKAKADKARLLEEKVYEAADETVRLKERVRSDIRKIRVREKELENRLEIARKDAEVLIGARENKIVELKRKLDLLEFNMDLLQDQYAREKERSEKLRGRLLKAAQVVKLAGGVLDTADDLRDSASTESYENQSQGGEPGRKAS
ncbi:MAG: hypothetical protein AABZ06_06845 [Bdellovibrionota bacterium]